MNITVTEKAKEYLAKAGKPNVSLNVKEEVVQDFNMNGGQQIKNLR